MRYDIYIYIHIYVIRRITVNATPRQLYPRERDPAPIVREAEWAPEQE